ncbi:hypothetical protein K438DRAFT_1797574 [Mycena galopus ATCC 62051]|nr:hypothetical protein K438DRAFT_1797574 [Mycena galopus ATCC 62051]
MPCHHSTMDVFDDIDDVFIVESAEERRTRELRTQQNELVPISRLPPEILADIFVRCVPTSIRKLHSDLSWLHVTRVSSRWRGVALSCPDLWSTLLFSRPKWMPVMLVRSKMASLAVHVDLKKDAANSPEPILLEHTLRLGTLDIRSPQHQLTTFLANLEHANSAPRLQCIKVVNTDTNNLGQGGMWLPSNLFRRTEVMENRQVGRQPGVWLHLEACAFPWDSGWYSHLVHLHLENIHSAQRPTIEAFLAILIASPNLQTLTLIHCSPTTHRRGCLVELPCLTTLTIKSDPPSPCLRLLGYLKIPPSATIDATVKGNYDNQYKVYQDLFPAFTMDSPPETYDTVQIAHKPTSFTFSLFHSAHPEWSRILRADTAWSYLNAIEAMKTVRNYLDFSNVTTLHLRGMDCLPPPPAYEYTEDVAHRHTLSLWDTLGRALPRVHTLHLHKSFPALWLDFLLTQAMLLVGVMHYRSCFSVPMLPPRPADISKAKKQRGLPFRDPDGALTHGWPGLRCLALHEINLSERVNEQQGPPACSDVLLALLWARRQGRAPIWRLEIKDCTNVSKSYLPYFRLFADVEYDGKGELELDEGVGQLDSVPSYSINVFADMVEFSRLARQSRE